jgi:hypothetical protein
MYGLPKDFDVSVFVGKVLDSVSFSANTVSFAFGDADAYAPPPRLSITVQFSLQHQLPSESDQSNRQSVPLSESKLMQLPGHSVVRANIEDDGTLVVAFDNEHVLTVFHDQSIYDSYEIDWGDRETIVWSTEGGHPRILGTSRIIRSAEKRRPESFP